MRGILVTLAAIVVATGMTTAARAEPLRLAVTDVTDEGVLAAEFGAFAAALGEASGEEIVLVATCGRLEAAQMLKEGELDLVLAGPSEYVLIDARTPVQPLAALVRADYFTCLVVPATSEVRTVKELEGRTVALGPAGSTASHGAPLAMIAEAGLAPADVSYVVMGEDEAFAALGGGAVDAVAVSFAHFLAQRVASGAPASAFRVIARSGDLPGDVLLAGAHVEATTMAAIGAAFASDGDALLAALLEGSDNQKYAGARIEPEVNAAEYVRYAEVLEGAAD